jgi:hypothetical protein
MCSVPEAPLRLKVSVPVKSPGAVEIVTVSARRMFV